MEMASYYTSAVAFVVVMALWFLFAATFFLRKKPPKAKDAVKMPKSWFGIGLQGLAFAFVWTIRRTPIFSPFVNYDLANIALQVFAAALSSGSVLVSLAAVRELGKHWSFEARLVEGHKLVTSGVYGIVRHPIYSAMLGMLIATGIVLSHWIVLIAAAAIFLLGTFIRTRLEERLLRDSFGNEFEDWRSQVAGLIPFMKFL